MFCLLCHEKIPRLRAWRTKSEFCCDEHAELYKKQTLERLLTDQNSKSGEAPPLPIETSSAQTSKRPGENPSHAESILARYADDKTPKKPASVLPEPVQKPLENRDGGLQELWKLAEEVGNSEVEPSDEDWGVASRGPLSSSKSGSFPSLGSAGSSSGPREQTAEEALAALRAIASTSRSPQPVTIEDSEDPFDRAANSLESAAEHELNFATSGDDLYENALQPLDAGALVPFDDSELPSILDRLTESSGAYAGLPDLSSGFTSASEEEAIAERQLTREAEPPPNIEEMAQFEEAAPLEEITLEDAVPGIEDTARLDEIAAAPELDTPLAASEGADEPLALDQLPDLPASDSEIGGLDFLAEAVESHLEQAEEKPVPQEPRRKVLPFPTSRPKAPLVAEPEKSKPAPERVAAPPQKLAKARRPGDSSRLQMKPVATMYGLEPVLREPAGEAFNFAETRTFEQLAEPQLNYPKPPRTQGRSRRDSARLPLATRLWIVLPAAPEFPSHQAEPGYSAAPGYAQPCETPLPLAAALDTVGGRSIGSPRTAMFAVEPTLRDAAPFEFQALHGESSFTHLELPSAILDGAVLTNGSSRLDLSGPEGRFEPSVNRAFVVLPNISEPGASLQSSSNSAGGGLNGWMPPSVLDPRFEIERPAGRDLSDFG